MSTLNQNVLDEFISYLKTKYKNIIHQITLEHCTDDYGDYINLILIKIKKSQRRKGYGSAIMYELCAIADSHNVRVKLYAVNIYGTDLKALYAFYGKHGFVLIKNDILIKNSMDEMIYYPLKK